MKKNILILTVVISLFVPFVIQNAHADNPIPSTPTSGGTYSTSPDPSIPATPATGGTSASNSNLQLKNPLKVNSIGALLDDALTVFTYIVVLLGVLALILTGLQFILAQGNTEKMKEAGARLRNIVIGIAIVLAARVLVTVLINTFEATGTIDPKVIQSAKDAVK
jgi:hypothetical protein